VGGRGARGGRGAGGGEAALSRRRAGAGAAPADPASSTVPVGDYLGSLRRGASGLTIGVPRNYFFEGVDAEIQRAFEEAMGTLRKLGAEVRDVRIPSLRGTMSFLLILMAEAYAYH